MVNDLLLAFRLNKREKDYSGSNLKQKVTNQVNRLQRKQQEISLPGEPKKWPPGWKHCNSQSILTAS